MTAASRGPEKNGARSVIVEADGGSRGNPGPAAYGAVLKDADDREVIAEDGTTIGVATNNVAEYSGLIAGLKLAEEFAPEADIEVRMDSKLVVEQMSGRWKIKHPDMRPLAIEANRLAPFGTTYTWVPREQNKHADRLANEALDGKRSGVTAAGAALVDEPETGRGEEVETEAASAAGGRRQPGRRPRSSWSGTASHRTPRPRGSPAARERQPRAQRRGPRPDPDHRGVADPDRRGHRRGRVLAGTPHPGVGGDHRRALGKTVDDRARLRGDGVRRPGTG